jgi:hypothetical protein
VPKAKYKRLTLKIDGYTPHTLPMVRLADYLRDLAALLGAENDAHFIEVSEGSAELVHEIPEPNYIAIQSRVIAAQRGAGPPDAVRGYRDLKTKLRHDQKQAEFLNDRGRKVIEFPSQEAEPIFGSVTQPGSLEGILIKLGGRDETVPVHLQDADRYYKCTATRAMAKELRAQLFERPIRIHGNGRWNRNDDGEWTLEWFKITGWEPLNDDALEAVLSRMRIAESGWDKIADPLQELRRIRKGNGGDR